MSGDIANDHVDALIPGDLRRFQHGLRLSNALRIAEENLQRAFRLPAHSAHPLVIYFIIT